MSTRKTGGLSDFEELLLSLSESPQPQATNTAQQPAIRIK